MNPQNLTNDEMPCSVCKQTGHNARSCPDGKTKKPLITNAATSFVKQNLRKDILTNMLLHMALRGKMLFELLMSDNHTSPDASRCGNLFESIVEILILTKTINGINYTEMMSGDLSNLIVVSNAKTILNKPIHQGGNVSDITIKEGDCLTGISCKYNKNMVSKKGTDAHDLESEIKKYTGNYKVSIFVKDKNNISASKKNNIHKETFDKIQSNKLVFDEQDVIKAIDVFCSKFANNTLRVDDFIENVINADYLLSSRKQLVLKLHQKMTEIKFVKSYLTNQRKMWCIAHKPRSGKSITILTICKYLLETGLNKILIMTSVPATINDFVKDLEEYVDFKHINYKRQEDFESTDEDFKGIVFCSVQYLKTDGKIAKKDILKRIGFELIVTDECHLGGSTDKTRSEIIDVDSDIVEDIRKGIRLSIFASGTADKTIKYYRIKPTEVYEWEIIDEGHMKELANVDFMVKRHGPEFLECLENTTLNHDYSSHPAQVLMKHSIPEDLIRKINEYNTKYGTNYGYNCSSLFALRKAKKQEPEKIKKTKDGNDYYEYEYAEEFDLCKDNDGKEILKWFFECIISEDPMKNDTIMKCIETTQTSYSSRKSSTEKPLLFIIYLPTHTGNNTIATLQKTFKNFLKTHGLWSDYNIEYSNSSDNSSYVNQKEYADEIASYMTTAKRENKKGCILLLGNKGSVGITYHDCDVTISLDDGHNLDNQKQRFARALTGASGKTIGINVDMNIQRTYLYLIDMIHKHRKNTKTTMTNAEIMQYLYEHKIFLFNPHQFNNGKCTTREIISYYESEAKDILREIDDTQILENIVCDDLMRDLIKMDFQKSITQKKVNKDFEGDQQDCPKGDKTKIQIDGPQEPQEPQEPDGLTPEETEILINQTYELCKGFLFPVLSLISRSFKIFDFKELFVTGDFLYLLLRYKIEELNKDKYIFIINIMNNIIDNNAEIVDNIREIYRLASPEKLRYLIAKHFIPTQEEKNGNAEIPTPVPLVDDMLDKIPSRFWKTPQKVFEPCCGKGNFVLGIFDRFYNGLAEMYPNVKERCRIIMTECIYYADLTMLNVFITTEIMKCHVQMYCGMEELDYEFNNHTGDTLKINISSKWGISGFHAVIGNPPYQDSSDEGSRKALNHNLWGDFINYSFKIIVENGYLLFITPCSWMSPTSKNKDVFYNNYIVYLNVNECEKYFKGIGSKFSYYLIQNTSEKKETEIVCLYNKKTYNSKMIIRGISFLPNLLCRESLSVIYKFYNNEFQKVSFNKNFELHSSTHKNKIKDVQDEVFKFPIRHTTKRDVRYSNVKHSLSTKHKILMNLSGDLKPIYDEGILGFTEAQLYLLSENKNYVNVLNSKLYMFVFKICKWSGFNIDKVFHNIPYVVVETDADLYTHFGLTSDEIALIEKVV